MTLRRNRPASPKKTHTDSMIQNLIKFRSLSMRQTLWRSIRVSSEKRVMLITKKKMVMVIKKRRRRSLSSLMISTRGLVRGILTLTCK